MKLGVLPFARSGLTYVYRLLAQFFCWVYSSVSNRFSLYYYILNICRLAYIQLRQIGFPCHLLIAQATQLLSVLSFCPTWTIAPAYLLSVHSTSMTNCRKFRTQLHNLSARQKANNNKNDHVQPSLQLLHWLPNRAQTQYKISMFCFNVTTGTGPQYLYELLYLYISSRELVPLQIHTFSKILILVPRHLVRDHFQMSVPLPGMTFHTSPPFWLSDII